MVARSRGDATSTGADERGEAGPTLLTPSATSATIDCIEAGASWASSTAACDRAESPPCSRVDWVVRADEFPLGVADVTLAVESVGTGVAAACGSLVASFVTLFLLLLVLFFFVVCSTSIIAFCDVMWRMVDPAMRGSNGATLEMMRSESATDEAPRGTRETP